MIFFGVSLVERISSSLTDKLSRFLKKDINENEVELIEKCIKTAICQAFYFVLRDIYNMWLLDDEFKIDINKKISNLVFYKRILLGCYA